MHKVLTAIVVSAIALIAVGAAWAAGPTFRDRIQISETDTDFCGTGKIVLIGGQIVANGWIAETGGADDLVKLTFNLTITYTNPLNGASAVERWSELETNQVVSGVEGEAHTHEFSNTGLKAMIKLANGPVLTRDAGTIVYRVSFDANGDFAGLEVVADRGDHPGFYDDLFCSTMVDALGL